MTDQGFNVLINLKDAGLPWGRSGMAVTEEWLAANPNTALNILAATLEGQDTIFSDADTAVANYAEFAQVEEDTARAIVEDFQTVGNHSMIWVDKAFETPKEVLATVNPDISDVDVADAYDRGPSETLQELGYYDALGIEIPAAE
jgi:ABC-type nitrate/sulfonate/bicarbonate transport system substrate-binding protein